MRYLQNRSLIPLFLLVAGVLFSPGRISAQSHSYVPKEGFVPNEKTAIRIAEAVLGPIYGEDQIAKERPFAATLKGGVWTIEGH
jgi:hypothetical protein